MLKVLADHVAGDVLQEEQRDVLLVAELDELGGLLRTLGEEWTVVAQNADRETVDPGPATDQGRAVPRLELLELRAVDDASDDLSDIHVGVEVSGHQAQEVFGVMHRLDRGPGLARSRACDD